jgi:hypothetical protein
MSPFTDVSFKQFMDSASTFFEATQRNSCDNASANNGFKALSLLYFGHSENWSADEVNESVEIIKSAAKRILTVERRNA